MPEMQCFLARRDEYEKRKMEERFFASGRIWNKFCRQRIFKSVCRHLFVSKEYLAKQIASIHNLFYLDLVKVAREHIIAGDFYEWKNSVVPILRQRL
jgi:queuine tRNA-ribosyltransferase